MLAGRVPAGEDRAECRLSETRQELAAFLSMKPETLSRSLRTLTERGVIVVDGRVVPVPSRAGLLAQLETAG